MKKLIVLLAIALATTGCAVGTVEEQDTTADVPDTRNATVVIPEEEVEPPPNKPRQIREEGQFENPLDPITGVATK